MRSIIPDATIYKLAHMVGTEDRMYNNYAQLAKMLPFIPIFDGGRTKLQPVYVRDVADAVISSLKRKEAVGKDYYLAGPDVFTYAPSVLLVMHLQSLRQMPAGRSSGELTRLHVSRLRRPCSSFTYPFTAPALGARKHSSAASTVISAAIRLFMTILSGVCRIKQMIELVFETIREPMRIVNVPVAIGKLLAAPRERFFKSVRILHTHIEHSALSLQN